MKISFDLAAEFRDNSLGYREPRLGGGAQEIALIVCVHSDGKIRKVLVRLACLLGNRR